MYYTILSSFYWQGLVHNMQSSYCKSLQVIKDNVPNGVLLANERKSMKNI